MSPSLPALSDASTDARPLGRWLGLALVGWLCLVAVGLTWVATYQTTPGVSAGAPALWPAHSSLGHSAAHGTIVLFVHPECACSRASVNELNEVMNQSPHARAVIVFSNPSDRATDWQRALNWQRAAELPRTRRVIDWAGREAELFGARTSGQAVVYGRDGRLLFSGGLTEARGHEGDNGGQLGATSALNGTPAESHPVYGCALPTLSEPVREEQP